MSTDGAASRVRKIGAWLVRRRISVGGASEVFLAAHADSPDRVAAVKVLLPHLAEDPTAVAAFRAEVQLLRRIESPYVARVLDSGDWLGSPWMALAYVAGLDLAALQRSRKGAGLEGPELAALGLLGARSLAAVHGACDASGKNLRIIHRDISPQNFVVADTGALTLIDFGIARQAGVRGATETGVIKGKHAYMSPEQVRREPLDARSDIFSFGIVLWELATGKRLFQGNSVIDTLEKVEAAVFARVCDLNRGLDHGAAEIIEACLAGSPTDRPDSLDLIDGFGRALQRQLHLGDRLDDKQVIDLLAGIVKAAGPTADGDRAVLPTHSERT